LTKNFKLKIKKTELAKAAGLDKLKAKLARETPKEDDKKVASKAAKPVAGTDADKEPRRIRAKTKSSFAPSESSALPSSVEEPPTSEPIEEVEVKEEELPVVSSSPTAPPPPIVEQESVESPSPSVTPTTPPSQPILSPVTPPSSAKPLYEKLGPTGRHVDDLLPVKKKKEEAPLIKTAETTQKESPKKEEPKKEDLSKKEVKKPKKLRDFKDLKPAKKQEPKAFDARDRQGLTEEDDRWRKKRGLKQRFIEETQASRPSQLKIRLPITVKDLASDMKLKASDVIQKLFLHGMTYTLNDFLEDETSVQFIGHEFGCEITIDTSEKERIQITAQTIQEEIQATDRAQLIYRAPVVAFMGHVDHGKTSLIDAIRKSNRVAGESGAITQHIGAFMCKTPVGDITILDTPGHEAFSAMRTRGAEVTDIVVLVVAGDEGMREQTYEALQQAKDAKVTIVVAVNKCDRPGFNPETVYRQLSEKELLPEAWGGQTITVNTSAVTGEGISTLLEMLALQAEVLELTASQEARARGTVLESEMHKGMGSVATILVQNGTLHIGDALVFGQHWGRVKTIQDEYGKHLRSAGPSTPVAITGLSGLPSAGDPFIVVKNEKEAREIIEARAAGQKQQALLIKKSSGMDRLMKKEKKILKLILRGDVQGSVEALKTSIMKIKSDKIDADIIFVGVGEVSESDIELAFASQAVIIGFHTRVENHAEALIKARGVTVRLFDVIYHAIEEVKKLMKSLLDKIEEEKETGKAEVKALFKASHLGLIAGCQVIDGTITRGQKIRALRDNQVVWKGNISSLKRVKEDVKEVKKGLECGILLEGFKDVQVGDLLQAYEIIYHEQEL